MKFDTIIFDLDGVIYRGTSPREGIPELFQFLSEAKLKYHFLTNTSVTLKVDIQQKLKNFGVPAMENDITTSSEILSFSLLNVYNPKHIIAITIGGGQGLINELTHSGFECYALNDESEKILRQKPNRDFVLVIGWTDSFNYHDVARLLNLHSLFRSTHATDADIKFASDKSYLPGTGWVVGAIEKLNGSKIPFYGKPDKKSIRYVLRKISSSRNRTLVVGDNLETDILAGKRAGCSTCLVLGGISSQNDITLTKKELRPDFIIRELGELISILNNNQ